MTKIKTDNDILDMVDEFMDFATEKWGVEFYAITESEHCHMAMDLHELVTRHEYKETP